MKQFAWDELVSIEPDALQIEACLEGDRVNVLAVIDLLSRGHTPEEIIEKTPGLTAEDIETCIAFGDEIAHQGFVDPCRGH